MPLPLFQSLIGFKINWNYNISILYTELFTFQSLIGFKINWNIDKFSLKDELLVSIPNRV